MARARAGELEGAREAERREELQGHPASPRSEAEAREGGRREGEGEGERREEEGCAGRAMGPRRELERPRRAAASSAAAPRGGRRRGGGVPAGGAGEENERERAGGREDADGGKKISDLWARLLVVGIEWRYRK